MKEERLIPQYSDREIMTGRQNTYNLIKKYIWLVQKSGSTGQIFDIYINDNTTVIFIMYNCSSIPTQMEWESCRMLKLHNILIGYAE